MADGVDMRRRKARRYAIQAAASCGFTGAALRDEARLIEVEALGGAAYDWGTAAQRAREVQTDERAREAGVPQETITAYRAAKRVVPDHLFLGSDVFPPPPISHVIVRSCRPRSRARQMRRRARRGAGTRRARARSRKPSEDPDPLGAPPRGAL
jgi:hypothetical protein